MCSFQKKNNVKAEHHERVVLLSFPFDFFHYPLCFNLNETSSMTYARAEMESPKRRRMNALTKLASDSIGVRGCSCRTTVQRLGGGQ